MCCNRNDNIVVTYSDIVHSIQRCSVCRSLWDVYVTLLRKVNIWGRFTRIPFGRISIKYIFNWFPIEEHKFNQYRKRKKWVNKMFKSIWFRRFQTTFPSYLKTKTFLFSSKCTKWKSFSLTNWIKSLNTWISPIGSIEVSFAIKW